MSDLGNFVGLFLLTWVIAMGIGLVAGLISGVFMAIAPVLGVFIMAVLFIAFVPAPQFGQYAVLVHKLRSGLFNWSMYGPGFSRYFSVLMRMIGFQIVVALPMLIWALISAGTVGTLMLTVFRGGAPSDTEALGAGLGGMVVVGLVGLVAMIVQIWLSVRLAFGAGRIIIHDRSLGEALAESWSATSRQQMDVFMVGLALFGVALAAGIALGIVGAILGMVPVLGTIVMFVVNTVVGGLLNLWMMLVLWIAYRDNYGIGDAVAIPRS